MTRKQKAIEIIMESRLEDRLKQMYVDRINRQGVKKTVKSMLQYLPVHAFERGMQAAFHAYCPDEYSQEKHDTALDLECQREIIIGRLLDLLN